MDPKDISYPHSTYRATLHRGQKTCCCGINYINAVAGQGERK